MNKILRRTPTLPFLSGDSGTHVLFVWNLEDQEVFFVCLLWDVSLLINFDIPAFLLSRVPVNVELFVRCSPITFCS